MCMFGWSPESPPPSSPTNRDITFGILMEDKDSELYYHRTGVGGFPERKFTAAYQKERGKPFRMLLKSDYKGCVV